jgi:recombinational DNA repair protein (RecF pathway)
MAYVTYTTEALVCGTFNRNTSDNSYLLFTREAGMLYADARSSREERSRQRYALQDFSLVRVSLVKGKRGWKVGSIEARKNYYHEAGDKMSRGSVVSLFRLLRRFLKGEEIMKDIFDLTKSGLETLKDDTPERMFVEEVIQLRILADLGYVDKKRIPEPIRKTDCFDIHNHATPGLQQSMNSLYSHAIDISHL